MKKMLSVAYTWVILALDGRTSLWARFAFTARYFFDFVCVVLCGSQPRKVHFLNGRRFLYLGGHINLLLDHIAEHIRSYRHHYQTAETVLDVGASFGTFALMVNYYNPKARVFSFEPSYESFELLSKNCDKVNHVALFNNAVGEKESEVRFKFEKDYPEGSRVSEGAGGDGEYSVKQISLDQFVSERGIAKIDLLKIDTEGYELNVLKGAEKTLPLTDKIIIETDNEVHHLARLLEQMGEKGFKLINFGSINFDHKEQEIGSLDLIFKKK